MPDLKRDTLPERVTFYASLAIVLALLGFLGWHGLTTARSSDAEAAPMATVRVLPKKTVQREECWAVPIQVKNVGNVPLGEVQVRVEMRNKEGKPQEVDLSFPYLAEKATEETYVVLEVEPCRARVEARVISFQTQQNARGY